MQFYLKRKPNQPAPKYPLPSVGDSTIRAMLISRGLIVPGQKQPEKKRH